MNAGNAKTYAGPYVGGDSIYCTITANDGTVNGNTLTTTVITIGETPPVVSNVRITPSPVRYGTDLTCAYDYFDADGDGDASTITWQLNGSNVATGAQYTANNFRADDVMTCVVTAVDDTPKYWEHALRKHHR